PGGRPDGLPLKHASADNAMEVIRAAYPDGQLRLTRDDQTNTLYVQGTPAEIQAVRRLLEALDSKKQATEEKPLHKPHRLAVRSARHTGGPGEPPGPPAFKGARGWPAGTPPGRRQHASPIPRRFPPQGSSLPASPPPRGASAVVPPLCCSSSRNVRSA